MASLWEKVKGIIFVEEEVEDEVEDEPVKEEAKDVNFAPEVDIPASVEVEQPAFVDVLDGKNEKISVTSTLNVEVPEQTNEFVTFHSNKPKPTSEPTISNNTNASYRSDVTSNYVFTQVISPIFGDTSKTQSKETTEQPVSLNPLPNVENTSPLGTVLSPLNGALEDQKNEHIPEKISSLTIDDMINDDFFVDLDQEEEPDISPINELPRRYGDTENLSLFDDEEQ